MTTTTSATSTSTSSSTAALDRASLSSNFETFLKLLTTQLQYQDPMAPMDTNEFTQQLVQYSEVEQQLKTNDQLEQLIKLNQGQGTQAALGYLGWEVSSETSDLPLQSGYANFNITLEEQPTTVSIGIVDSTGKTVKGLTLTGEEFAHDGKLSQDIVWDGKDNNGNQLDDGTYTIVVTATNSAGSSIEKTVLTRGTVTGIDVDEDGNTVLRLGDMLLDPDNVKSVRAPSSYDDGSTDEEDSSSSS